MMKEFENLLILWWMEVYKSYFQKYLNEYYSLTFKKGHVMITVGKEVQYAYYKRTRGT